MTRYTIYKIIFSQFILKFVNRCLTGSYDRTCKVWDIDSGTELLTLEGHKNVVYTVSFNNPISYVSFNHRSYNSFVLPSAGNEDTVFLMRSLPMKHLYLESLCTQHHVLKHFISFHNLKKIEIKCLNVKKKKKMMIPFTYLKKKKSRNEEGF